MHCYRCHSGHAMKLTTLMEKNKSVHLHGLCVGCMGKLEACVYKLKDAIRLQSTNAPTDLEGRLSSFVAEELGLTPPPNDDTIEDLTTPPTATDDAVIAASLKAIKDNF